MWIKYRIVLTRMFRRAHQNLGPTKGGLVDRRQLESALADSFERWHFIEIQHV
jgi:hypothetical protein